MAKSFRSILAAVFIILIVSVGGQRDDGFGSGEADEITSLPGLPSGVVTFRQYSGYLRASATKKLHYWLAESLAEPATDPLVLWLNGGPGCSSLEGFLTENGPFRVNAAGDQLYTNPYSWNRHANTLYIEAPAGVGFSYSDDANYTTNDDVTADDNHRALQDFFVKFPRYRGRDFYISGESYAGIYIPTLAVRVAADPGFSLKGIAIGNGVLRRDFLSDSKLKYFYYFGLMGTSTFTKMVDSCCNANDKHCSFFPFTSKDCERAVGEAYVETMKASINPYNVHAPCEGLTAAAKTRRQARLTSLMLKTMMISFQDSTIQEDLLRLLAAEETSPPCTVEDNVARWLNSGAVRRALHIHRASPTWTLCSPRIDETTYSQQYTDVEPFIRQLLKDKSMRILIFNGDLDSVCDFFGDQRFVDSLNLTERIGHKSWHYSSAVDGTRQVGGFVRHFEQLNFVTVKGAGHMVPTDQPVAALKMFTNFLNNKDFE